jgi:hypothetical protein
MATMYNSGYSSGYGGDMSASYAGQTATDEEERRRRQAAQQQSVLLNRPMVEVRAEPSEVNPQSREEAGGQSSTQARNTQQQQTFAQLQAAGQARPAPPPPQQPPQQQMQPQATTSERFMGPMAYSQAPQPGLDPLAAAMGSQQAEFIGGPMVYAQAGGGTSVSQHPLLGGGSYNPNTGQQYGPTGQPRSGKSNVGVPAPGDMPIGGFDGDIGGYLAGQLNGITPGQAPEAFQSSPEFLERIRQLNAGTLPGGDIAYNPAADRALTDRVNNLGGLNVNAPQYTPDPNVNSQLEQLLKGSQFTPGTTPTFDVSQFTRGGAALPTQWPTSGRSGSEFVGGPMVPAMGGAPSAVSAQGVNPLAAAQAQAPAPLAQTPAAQESVSRFQAQGYTATPGPYGTIELLNQRGQYHLLDSSTGRQIDSVEVERRQQENPNAQFSGSVVPGGSFAQRGFSGGANTATQPVAMSDDNRQIIADAFTQAMQTAKPGQPGQGAMWHAGLQSNVQFVVPPGGTPVVSVDENNPAGIRPGQSIDVPGFGQVQVADKATYNQALASSSGAPQPAAQKNPMDDFLQQQIMDAIRNPSAFDNAEVQRLYNQMGEGIDDRFAQEETKLREEMAARGLSDSSIQGGRLADLNVGRRSAQTELANQLLTQRAQDFAQSRDRALGLGLQSQGNTLQAELGRGNLSLQGELGRGRLELDSELGRGNLDLGRQRAATEAELGRADIGVRQQQLSQQASQAAAENALNRDRLSLERTLGMGNLDLSRTRANQDYSLGLGNLDLGRTRAAQDYSLGAGNLNLQSDLGRGRLGLDASTAAANIGLNRDRLALDASGQKFDQGMRGLDFQNRVGQQNFANQMSTAELQARLQDQNFRQGMGRAEFEANQNQRGFQNQISAADLGLRRSGQAFDQNMRGLDFENRVGQQGFQNRMSTAELNRLLGNDAFSQRMGVTDRLSDYGQRAFDNDMRRAEFNRNQQNDAWRRYLDSIVLGG